MKNIFTLLFLSLAISLLASAQALRVVSTKFYCTSQPTTFEKITDIIQTQDGGFFFTGKAHKPGGGILPTCGGIGANPVMGKLNAAGNIEWIKNFCDTPAVASTVCQTPDGGYAINGGSYPWASMSIFRYDALGNYLWRKDYGKGANSGTSQIMNTPDNGFLLLGNATTRDSDITVTYDWPPRTLATVDWVLIKLDSLGNKQWVRTLGTSGDDLHAKTLICDGKNYYLIGSTITKDYDCADLSHPGSSIYTIKLDFAGNVLWSKAYGWGFVNKVLYDERDGTILTTGRVRGNGQEFTGGMGGDDIFLMKVDTSGNYKWGKLYGTARNDQGHDICKAPNGGYFVAGHQIDNLTSNATASGILLSVDNNGKQLDFNLVRAGPGGVVFQRIFSQGSSYVALGVSSSRFLQEGTGQNCTFPITRPIDTALGSDAMILSKLNVVPVGTAFTEVAPALTFTLSPNPAHSSFEVHLAGRKQGGQLLCTSSSGSVIYRQAVDVGQERILVSTAHWAPGNYIICWQPAGGAQQCQKLVVQ